jgi:hypothetical protein
MTWFEIYALVGGPLLVFAFGGWLWYDATRGRRRVRAGLR